MIDTIAPPVEAKELAYAVTDTEEGEGGLIFAFSSEEALEIGSRRYGDGDPEYFSARREPRADHLVSRAKITASFLVELGWHFECGYCSERITEDNLYDRDLTTDDVQGTQDSAVYCSPVCEASWKLEHAKDKAIENRWVRKLRLYILKKYPEADLPSKDTKLRQGAYIARRDGRPRLEEVFVEFKLPCSKHGPLMLKFQRSLPLGERFLLIDWQRTR